MKLLVRQIGYELLKMAARKRTYIGFGAFAAAQLAILLLMEHPRAKERIGEQMARAGLAFADYYQGLTLAVVIIVFTFVLLGALYVALVSGDIVAKEVEDGTLRMVLTRPISRLRLLAIKTIAASIHTVGLVFFLGFTALLLSSIYKGGPGKLFVRLKDADLLAFYDTGPGLLRYALALALLSYATLAISSLALMFSCFRMKPAAATILTLSVFFVDMILQGMPFFSDFHHWFIAYHAGFWVHAFHAQIPWPRMAESAAYLLALNVTFLVIASLRFTTQDFKN